MSRPGHSGANLSWAFLGVDEAPFQTELQIPLVLITPTQGLLSRIVSKHFHNTEHFLWALTSSCGAREMSSCAALW